MAAVWNYCKGKSICEADAEPEEGDSENPEPSKKGHGGCGHIQPQIRKEGLKLFLQYKRSKGDDEDDFKAAQPDKRLFTPLEVFNVLRKISDEDLALLGLSDEYARPDWMILTILPVPPPPVRPSISADGGAMRSEDDLTYKLGDIIKASANVRRCEEEGAPAHVIAEFEQLLQVRYNDSILNPMIELCSVSCGHLYGQRYRWYTAGSAEVWSPGEGHPRSLKGQGRSSTWESYGKAC